MVLILIYLRNGKIKLMKKLLTIIALFAAFGANAQFGINSTISTNWGGVKEAKQINWIPQYIDGKSHFGYSVGVFYDIKLSKRFYISPAIGYCNYSLSNLLYTHGSLPGSTEVINQYEFKKPVNYSFVEVPVLIKVKYKYAYFATGLSTLAPIKGSFDIQSSTLVGIKIYKGLSTELKYNYGFIKYNPEGYRTNRLSIGLSYQFNN